MTLLCAFLYAYLALIPVMGFISIGFTFAYLSRKYPNIHDWGSDLADAISLFWVMGIFWPVMIPVQYFLTEKHKYGWTLK